MDLVIIFYPLQMCNIDVAILFLILALDMMSIVSFWLTEWKEKWSEKLSTKQKPGESSLLRLSKEEKTSFRCLLVFIIGLLIFKHYLDMRWAMAM